MNRVASLLALAALALAAPAQAQAQKIYKCKNEKGEIYYSQAFDRTRCAGGGAQLNQQGLAVKEIPRVKSAEELAAEKKAAEEKAEADRIAAEQAESDRILLTAYSSEDDLKRVHDQQMQMIDTAVETAKLQLAYQQGSLADLLAIAAESERAKKPVPENIATSIATVRRQIEEQNATITRKEAERVTATADFEAKLDRYRKLIEAQKARM
ncbi:MAG: DUF4124 domain-containing protein [Xanthomonadaceae bacterium]|jgi:hypothetical protein|nr:DUF4124 domain-containing protein [Xanthomonadaceae bacterium]